MNIENKLILASASPRRQELLSQIDVVIDQIMPANIDEAPLKHEKPKNLVLRLAQAKAEAIYETQKNCFILAADTVVACGTQILGKPENVDQARVYLKKLSGRRHNVHGGISFITPHGIIKTRHCVSMVQFCPLNTHDIARYLDTGEWEGKAGGYAIQGYAGAFVKNMHGSYSNIVGLSLYDTVKMMKASKFLNYNNETA